MARVFKMVDGKLTEVKPSQGLKTRSVKVAPTGKAAPKKKKKTSFGRKRVSSSKARTRLGNASSSGSPRRDGQIEKALRDAGV